MASRLAHVCPSSHHRVRCSLRTTTMVVCGCNLVAALYLLHSFLAPLFRLPTAATTTAIAALATASSPPAPRYTEEQINRMKEALAIWKAAKPMDLIKRVNEIQQESAGGTYVYKPPEVPEGGKTSGLAQRLKALHDSNSKSEQEALEEWRRKKLEDARKRAESMKAKQQDYLDSLKI